MSSDSLPWSFQKMVGSVFQTEHDTQRAKQFDVFGVDTSAPFRAAAKISPLYDTGLSWRVSNCTSPVRDQGACGSCWAFGTTAALESAWCLDNNVQIDGAEQTVLECRSDVTRASDRCNGSWENVSYDVMRGQGIDQEARRPYRPSTFGACTAPTGTQQFYGIDAATHLTVPSGATRPTVQDIKNAVVEAGAVTLALTVTPAFDNYRAGSPAINTTAADLTRPRGGHMIAIVGWDDLQQAWHVKNSWNTGWGNGGFGYISYNDRSIWANNFSFVEPAVKYAQADRARIFKKIATTVTKNTALFTSNPTVQFPSSLGFSARKQSVVSGFQDAIARQLVTNADVATWPAVVQQIVKAPILK